MVPETSQIHPLLKFQGKGAMKFLQTCHDMFCIIRHGKSAGHRAALKKCELENMALQEESQIEEEGLTFAHVLLKQHFGCKGWKFQRVPASSHSYSHLDPVFGGVW